MTRKNIKNLIKSAMNQLPYVKTLYELNSNSKFPAGHFYSSVVSLKEMERRQNEIWTSELPEEIGGIELNIEKQLQLLREFSSQEHKFIFPENKSDKFRYFLNNPYFAYGDGVILFFMMSHFKPSRIVEIGSGFSSALMIDINEHFLKNKVVLKFVEPYPEERFLHLVDLAEQNAELICKRIQEVPLKVFMELQRGDILFVDSSHVVKTGSDVHFIINKILPILNPGVLVHFHDIHYPFEYPKKWVLNGFGWNEVYYIQAFLMYNEVFEIVIFNDLISKKLKDKISMPSALKEGGSSLWLQKRV